jgi:hypothetical protein
MGKKRGAYVVLVTKSDERNHFKDPGIDGSIVLK